MFGYCHNPECPLDLWAPEGHKDTWNRAFSAYAGSFELAARELASTPEAQYDETLQAEICAKYGIFLDNITDDEVRHLEMLIEEIGRV